MELRAREGDVRGGGSGAAGQRTPPLASSTSRLLPASLGRTPPGTPPHSWWGTRNVQTSAGPASPAHGRCPMPTSPTQIDVSAGLSHGSPTARRSILLDAASPVPRQALGSPKRARPPHAGQPQQMMRAVKLDRSQSDPVLWHQRTACGCSTLEIDQPHTSRFLAYIRYHGEPRPWRSHDDGLVFSGAAERSSAAAASAQRVPDVSFSTNRKGQLPDLRRTCARTTPKENIVNTMG